MKAYGETLNVKVVLFQLLQRLGILYMLWTARNRQPKRSERLNSPYSRLRQEQARIQMTREQKQE